MIRINDSYHVERIPRNWCLVHEAASKKRSIQYFGDILTLCKYCMNRNLDATGGFAKIESDIKRSHEDLACMIKKMTKEHKLLLKEKLR